MAPFDPWRSADVTVGLPFITSSPNALNVPDPASRLSTVIGSGGPPRASQLRIYPPKMPWICAVLRPVTGLSGLTITASASRAITI